MTFFFEAVDIVNNIMNVKKPYLLFHGYKHFDKFYKPSVNKPLWTADAKEACFYISNKKQKTSGMLLLMIDVKSLKIFDITDSRNLKPIFGDKCVELLYRDYRKKINSQLSFCLFWNIIFENFFNLETHCLDKKQLKHDKIFCDLVDNINASKILKQIKYEYDEFSDEIGFYGLDLLTIKFILPKIMKMGYNCVYESEMMVSKTGEYMLLSDEMLQGNCLKFVKNDKCQNFNECLTKLKEIDIYSRTSWQQALDIVRSYSKE